MWYFLIHLEFYAIGHTLNASFNLLNLFKSSELFREKILNLFKDYAFLQLHNKHLILLYTYS